MKTPARKTSKAAKFNSTLVLVAGGGCVCTECATERETLVRVVNEAIEAQVFAETLETLHCDRCGAALPTELDREAAPAYRRRPADLECAVARFPVNELRDLAVEMLLSIPEYVGASTIAEGGSEEDAEDEIRAAVVRIAEMVAREVRGESLGDVLLSGEADRRAAADAEMGGGF